MTVTTRLLFSTTIALAALTGCQNMYKSTSNSHTSGHQSHKYTQNNKKPITTELLRSQRWQLTSAKRDNGQSAAALLYDNANPLILNFTETDGLNRVLFENTCNNMGATYAVTNGKVSVSQAYSTMMACPQPQAEFDAAVGKLITGDYALYQTEDKQLQLVITSGDTTAHFKPINK